MASDVNHSNYDPRVQQALAPISEAQPAGTSARGEPEYDAVEEQIRKLESEGPGAVNWREFANNGLALLGTRSKDLLVGSWVAFALLQTEKLAGLGTGVAILRGMVDQFWETMSPPATRERARVAALEWLSGRASPVVSAMSATEAEWERVLIIYDDLTEVDRLAAEKLTKEQVAIGELIRALRPMRDEARRGLSERAKAEEAAREAAEKAAQASAQANAVVEAAAPVPRAPAEPASEPSAASATGGSPALQVSGDPDVAIAQLPEGLRALAAQIRGKSFFDPRAYALTRVASWLRIRQLPPDQGGKTGAAPPQAEITAAEALKAAGKHRELVVLAEEAAWTAPFWYDGHRLAAEALRAIGSDGQAAEAAIAGALSGHFRRFPALSGLAFADGTPFASPATLNWLGAAPQSQAGGSADLADTLLAEARAMIAAGRAPEGIDHLSKAARQTSGGRDRLLVQIAQAGFCLEVGLVAAAIPILDHATKTFDDRDLEQWDPALACRVAELRFRALSSSDATRLMTEERRRLQLDDTRARLSRLDLGIAAKILR
ncbi:VI_chp_7, type VI secretion-associated protein, VC_A0119 family [Rhabdaerophilaceae bacterium]